MPGYLVDEGGEKTHAVLTLDEYERLRKSEERLESVRGYAMEMMSAMSSEAEPEATGNAASKDSEGVGDEVKGLGDGESERLSGR